MEVVDAAVRLHMGTETDEESDDARHGGTLFNHSTRWNAAEKANCFTLLKRITNLKCVNSEVRSFQVSHKVFLQMGPWHHVGATTEITLDWKWINTVIQSELNPSHAI